MILNIAKLKTAENRCRVRLALAPDDVGIRAELAWCLFLQVIVRANQPHDPGEVPAFFDSSVTDAARLHAMSGETFQAAIRDAQCQELLRDCLKQVIAVTQISQNDSRQDMERLKKLVLMLGAKREVREAEELGTRALQRILNDCHLTRISQTGRAGHLEAGKK